MSYPIDIRIVSKNGWFTPDEAKAYYGRYDRHGITWHWWGGGEPASAHDSIANYLASAATNGTTSSNYVLSDIKISLLVGPDNVAFASQRGNPTTVSVELQPTLGAEGYKKAGWLARELGDRYGGDRAYYPHNYWNSTQCPGTISLDRIRQEEDKWQRGEYEGAPAPAPAPSWNFVPKIGKAKITGTDNEGLYVLKTPQLSGQIVTLVPEGTMMDFIGYVTNGDNVEGNTLWWKNSYGNYFSSRYAPEDVAPAPTPTPTPPAPTPAPEPVIAPVIPTKMYTLANAKLVNIKDMSVVKTFPIDTPMDIVAETTWNNMKFFITESSYTGGRMTGFLVGDLKAQPEPAPAPEPEQPEWVKNLRDVDDTEFWVKEDTKLIDITTATPVIGHAGFEKDDSFVASALTISKGVEYRITDYSFKKGIFNGVPIDKLTLTPPGVPDIPPVPVEPPASTNDLLKEIRDILKRILAFFGIK